MRAGYPLDAKAILLCESDGTPEEVAEEIARVCEVLNGQGATGIQVSRDEAERLRFWAGRKAAFPAAGRISPDYYRITSYNVCYKKLLRIALVLLALGKVANVYVPILYKRAVVAIAALTAGCGTPPPPPPPPPPPAPAAKAPPTEEIGFSPRLAIQWQSHYKIMDP